MRLLSTSLLISILAFAVSCSQGNYAQVEPDDLYFTHKDRKEANTSYMASATANSSYDYNDREVSNYTNQHSPTLTSKSLGSPTIQSTTDVFYDAYQNPDYVSAQANPSAETSGEYYEENYDLPIIETETVVPQTTINNYYGSNPYNSNFSPWSSFFSLSFNYGFGSFYNPYNDPFSPYYNPYYSSRYRYDPYGNRYYGYNNPWYSSYYGGGYPNYGSGSYCYYPVNYSGSSYSYTTDNASYRNGTSIITGPRRSRSTVTNYTDGQVVSRKRASYNADGNSGGRISNDATNAGRQVVNTVPVERQINPYKNNGTDKSRRAKYGDMNSSSPTIQSNNNIRRKINTTLERQRSRSNSGVVNSPSYRGNSSYNSRGSRNSSYTPSRSGQSSRSYTKPRSNSSYKPSRSNSSSKPSYKPSRSSSTPRSTPSRSSGTQSSSSTSRKRN